MTQLPQYASMVKNVKYSLYLIKHHLIKNDGGVEVQLYHSQPQQ
jgi:hypothetical protein